MAIRQSSLEAVAMNEAFWRGKRVLVTGHTGFKGGWLTIWLRLMGAEVIGFALPPTGSINLYSLARVADGISSVFDDIRDYAALERVMQDTAPDIVLHLAAQSLVRPSYVDPLTTLSTNVMGTANVLQAARQAPSVRVALVITSDKCYENREWLWAYRENEPMGGADPYSASKGCAEIVTNVFRTAFGVQSGCAIGSARAGNVIGGGDWSIDRLIPDAMRAFIAHQTLEIRNPSAVRPWQHVLEPLCGYLRLAELMWERPADFAQAWNFGPGPDSEVPVAEIITQLATLWGGDASWVSRHDPAAVHEAQYLRLDISKSRQYLNWIPRWSLAESLSATVAWYRAYERKEELRAVTEAQISRYMTERLSQ
jgi:CDP-glucose 4,6-dehydratase